MKEKPEIVSSLSEENRQGYLKRLQLNSGVVLPDPYSISEQQWANALTCVDKWPMLKFQNIEDYLIHTPSEFTHESINAYRSLIEAYNYFISGHVQDCFFHEIDNADLSFMCSLVLPGQRQNLRNDSKMYDTWVCLHKSGRIQSQGSPLDYKTIIVCGSYPKDVLKTIL